MTFSSEEEAANAIAELNETELCDRMIFVREDGGGKGKGKGGPERGGGGRGGRFEPYERGGKGKGYGHSDVPECILKSRDRARREAHHDRRAHERRY